MRTTKIKAMHYEIFGEIAQGLSIDMMRIEIIEYFDNQLASLEASSDADPKHRDEYKLDIDDINSKLEMLDASEYKSEY